MSRLLFVKAFFVLLKETFADWSEDKAPRLGAALAYYAVFSLAPLLIIAVAIAGLAFGEEAARGQVVAQFQGLVGEESAGLIETMITSARNPSTGIFATIVGVVTLLLGAFGFFGQLQDALNTIWEVTPKPGRGIMGVIQDRFLSLTAVLGTGLLLLMSLAVSAALAAVDEYLGGLLPGFTFGLQIANFLLSFGVITLLFALIFYYLPDVKLAWRDVWIGAAVSALLFTLGKFAIGLYLGHSAVGSAFGAAGSLIVLLVWIYYSTQIFFFGAEFTQVYASKYGTRIKVPTENAMPVTEEARAQQGMAPRKQPPGAQGVTRRTTGVVTTIPGGLPVRSNSASLNRDHGLGRGYAAAMIGFVAGVSAGIVMAIENARRKPPPKN